MLRLLVVALLLANALFFGWSQGWLDRVLGTSARGEREPQRLNNQVRPELVRLWPGEPGPGVTDPAPPADQVAAATAEAGGASPASGPADAGTAQAPVAAPAAPTPSPAANPLPATAPAAAAPAVACLEAGPFAPADLQVTLTALAARLPAGSWTQRQVAGGEWMIYMGPYPDSDWMARKKAELGRIRGGVRHEDVSGGPLPGPGLSLGRFGSKAAADASLAQLRLRGIRTARVLRSGDGPAQVFLRLPAADAATAASVKAIPLQPAARSFTACP